MGVDSVRYIVGHHHDGNPPPDVPITLLRSTEMVSRPEVFDAADAAHLLHDRRHPPECSLRSVEGWTAEGTSVDLREHVASRNSKPSSSP